MPDLVTILAIIPGIVRYTNPSLKPSTKNSLGDALVAVTHMSYETSYHHISSYFSEITIFHQGSDHDS